MPKNIYSINFIYFHSCCQWYQTRGYPISIYRRILPCRRRLQLLSRFVIFNQFCIFFIFLTDCDISRKNTPLDLPSLTDASIDMAIKYAFQSAFHINYFDIPIAYRACEEELTRKWEELTDRMVQQGREQTEVTAVLFLFLLSLADAQKNSLNRFLFSFRHRSNTCRIV